MPIPWSPAIRYRRTLSARNHDRSRQVRQIGSMVLQRSDCEGAVWQEVNCRLMAPFSHRLISFRYFFPCNKWITLTEDQKEGTKLKQDGSETNGAAVGRTRPYHTLSFRSEPFCTVSANAAIVQYEMAVFTGDLIGAGTDANVGRPSFLTRLKHKRCRFQVYCILYGDKGDTGRRHLTQKFRNLFERGQRDVFIIESQVLGKRKGLWRWPFGGAMIHFRQAEQALRRT